MKIEMDGWGKGFNFAFLSTSPLPSFQGKVKEFPQKYSLKLHTYNCKLRTCLRNILVWLFMVKNSLSFLPSFTLSHTHILGEREKRSYQDQTVSNSFLFWNSKHLGMLTYMNFYMNIGWSMISNTFFCTLQIKKQNCHD